MKIEVLNQTKVQISQTFIKKLGREIEKKILTKISKKKLNLIQSQILYLVFLNKKAAQKMNFQFRQRDYATDVLSFDPVDAESLGELVMCPEVLKKQAKEHDLTFNQELSYMIIHGVLHLLGYEHENDEKAAQKMFRLQDSIYENLSQKLFDSNH